MADKNDNDNSVDKDTVEATSAEAVEKPVAAPTASKSQKSAEPVLDGESHNNGNGMKVFVGVVIVVIIVFLAATWLAENRARDMVANSIATFENDMQSRGMEAKITYEDMWVKSFTLSPEVQMSNLSVRLYNPAKAKGFRAEVPMVMYKPASFNMRSYSLRKSGDVQLHEIVSGRETGQILQVSHSESPVLHVEHNNDGIRAYEIAVPAWVKLVKTGESVAEDDAFIEPVTISLDNANSNIYWKLDANDEIIEQNINLNAVEVMVAESYVATIDALKFTLDHNITAGSADQLDQSDIQAVAQIENLQLASPELAVLNPIGLVNEISYHGPLMTQVQQSGVENVGSMEWELKNIAFMTAQGSIYINGDVTLEPATEKMPYGEVNVRVTEAAQLFAFLEQQQPENKAFIRSLKEALQKLSGTQVASGEPMIVAVSREPSGRLSIGSMSLEEVLAMGITLMMQMQSEVQPQEVIAPTEQPEMDESVSADPAEEMAEDAAEDATQTPAPDTAETHEEEDAADMDSTDEEASIEEASPAVNPEEGQPAE